MAIALVTIRDRARSVHRNSLVISKVLRRPSEEAVDKVRPITEDLAQLGAAQCPAVARLVEAAKRKGGRIRQALTAPMYRVTQAMAPFPTVIQ
jgi:hypothetical protein